MSANVSFGENKTPKIRPTGLIAGCASGAGIVVVAIENSSTTEYPHGSEFDFVFCLAVRANAGRNITTVM
jgi:hypothetical protein